MRIVVVGTSGSGKTTLAVRIASACKLPFIELDSLHWGPNWQALSETDPDEFVRRVRNATATDAWVSDGNYGMVRDLIWPRATHLVGRQPRRLAPLVSRQPSHQIRMADVARTAHTVRASIKRRAIPAFGGAAAATSARRGNRSRPA